MMGNSRSGRWHGHEKKGLVEDAVTIDVRDLLGHASVLYSGNGAVPVRNHSGCIVGQPDARLIPLEDGTRGLAFCTEFRWQIVPIRWPSEHAERRETLFACPGCESRGRKMYLPPGCRSFLCRDCHNLTYQSQQGHDPRVTRLKRDPDRLIRLMETADIDRDGPARYLLLMRAGWACIRDIEAELPPAVVEAVNEVIVSCELRKMAVG